MVHCLNILRTRPCSQYMRTYVSIYEESGWFFVSTPINNILIWPFELGTNTIQLLPWPRYLKIVALIFAHSTPKLCSKRWFCQNEFSIYVDICLHICGQRSLSQYTRTYVRIYWELGHFLDIWRHMSTYIENSFWQNHLFEYIFYSKNVKISVIIFRYLHPVSNLMVLVPRLKGQIKILFIGVDTKNHPLSSYIETYVRIYWEHGRVLNILRQCTTSQP